MQKIETTFGDFVWNSHYYHFECETPNHEGLKEWDLSLVITDVFGDLDYIKNNPEKVRETVEELLNKFVQHEKDGKVYITEIVEDKLFDMSFDWATSDWNHPQQGKLTKEALIDIEQLGCLYFEWLGSDLQSVSLSLWDETDLWGDHFVQARLDNDMKYINGSVEL